MDARSVCPAAINGITATQMNSNNRFEERYAGGDLPWDLGRVDRNLVGMVEELQPERCRALDIGCGTGDNSIWLARQGFDVTGVDIAPLAIEKAQAKARQQDVECRFIAVDFLETPVNGSPFGFVFDRGCFHSLESFEKHFLFAGNVGKHLGDDGLWLSLIASADAPQRDPGPPRLTAAHIAEAVEPFFEIHSLVTGHLDSNKPDPIRCWVCLMKKRNG